MIKLTAVFQFISIIAFAQLKSNDWPVLKTYNQEHIIAKEMEAILEIYRPKSEKMP